MPEGIGKVLAEKGIGQKYAGQQGKNQSLAPSSAV